VDVGGALPLPLRLVTHPLKLHGEERFVLLCFERQANVGDGEQPGFIDVDTETMARVEVLERELLATRQRLQCTIEELETSNEELQATNEEMMASNEELQSSNEELQSVNEELNTVNSEYQEKMAILNRLNSDMDSMSKPAGRNCPQPEVCRSDGRLPAHLAYRPHERARDREPRRAFVPVPYPAL